MVGYYNTVIYPAHTGPLEPLEDPLLPARIPWFTEMSLPMRTPEDDLYHTVLAQAKARNYDPIANPTLLLPERIPWYTPLAHEFNQFEWNVIPQMDAFQNLETTEQVHPDALFGKMFEPAPPPPIPIDYTLRFAQIMLAEVATLEEISSDKWFTSLAYEFNSRQMRTDLIPFGDIVPSGELENITIDKWFTELALPVRPTNHELYRSLLDVFHRMDTVPIPNIPGVYDMVFQNPNLPPDTFIPQPLTLDWRPHQDMVESDDLGTVEFRPYCPRPLARPDAIDPGTSPQRPDEGFAQGSRADQSLGYPLRPPDCPDRR